MHSRTLNQCVMFKQFSDFHLSRSHLSQGCRRSSAALFKVLASLLAFSFPRSFLRNSLPINITCTIIGNNHPGNK